MRKTVRNCRSLNMQTIKVRRGRPGSVSIALALAITMLVVYLLSLQAMPDDENAEPASAIRTSTEIRMEPMDVCFLLSSIHDDEAQARISAALCAQNSGAGLVLPEGDRFCVVYAAGKAFPDSDEPVLERRSTGLTLKIHAPAAKTAALSDGISALRTLADDTASLATSLEKGETDAKTVSSLLNIHQTRIRIAAEALQNAGPEALKSIHAALQNSLGNLHAVISKPDPAALRMLHAAACMEWIDLSNTLQIRAENP